MSSRSRCQSCMLDLYSSHSLHIQMYKHESLYVSVYKNYELLYIGVKVKFKLKNTLLFLCYCVVYSFYPGTQKQDLETDIHHSILLCAMKVNGD